MWEVAPPVHEPGTGQEPCADALPALEGKEGRPWWGDARPSLDPTNTGHRFHLDPGAVLAAPPWGLNCPPFFSSRTGQSSDAYLFDLIFLQNLESNCAHSTRPRARDSSSPPGPLPIRGAEQIQPGGRQGRICEGASRDVPGDSPSPDPTSSPESSALLIWARCQDVPGDRWDAGDPHLSPDATGSWALVLPCLICRGH